MLIPPWCERVLKARRDDASDADWTIYLQAAGRWQDPGHDTRNAVHEIDTGVAAHVALAHALEILGKQELIEEARPSAALHNLTSEQ